MQLLDEFAELGDFYPGSRERRDRPPAPAAGVEEDVLGEGKFLTVQGRRIEFFTIGQLARAINRTPVTLRAWEASKVIPKSGFFRDGKDGDQRGRRRLYTRAQCEAIIRLAKIHGVMDAGSRKPLDAFKHDVWAAFAELKGAPWRSTT